MQLRMFHEIRMIPVLVMKGHVDVGRLTNVVDAHDHKGRAVRQEVNENVRLSETKAKGSQGKV